VLAQVTVLPVAEVAVTATVAVVYVYGAEPVLAETVKGGTGTTVLNVIVPEAAAVNPKGINPVPLVAELFTFPLLLTSESMTVL
jgi:hypothetical protein